jgi:hypothetical protein
LFALFYLFKENEMPDYTLGNLPVFPKDLTGATVRVLKPSEGAIWDIGSGKIFAVEFEVKVEIEHNETPTDLIEKLYAPIRKTLALFPDSRYLYLTTRNQFWDKHRVPDSMKEIYVAVISATYMNVIRSMGEDGVVEAKA